VPIMKDAGIVDGDLIAMHKTAEALQPDRRRA
jgi:SOS-response transcriptional repressor LexA